MDISTNAVIDYRADISDVLSKVKTIQTVNSALAKRLGADFTQGMAVIKDQISRVQFDKTFKINVEGKGIQKVKGNIEIIERTIQTADGQLYKFTETIGHANNQSTKLAESLIKVASAQSKLAGQSSQLTTNFNSLTSINKSFGQQLSSMGEASRFLGTSLNQISQDGSKVSKIFETTNGKFVQLTETTSKNADGIQTVDRTVKELSKSQIQNISTLEGMNKSSRTFGQNLSTLLKRAALTIPVWFALRQGISSVFRTIRDGLKNLAEFDRVLQKLNRNLEATAKDGVVNLESLADKITEFSLKTGQSVEKVTNAIQKFATVGFDLETSLAGGLNSTKLAITLFGDAEETAQAFARSLRVLTEGMDSSEEKQRAIAEALALTDQLWQTNAFEISEFSGNLEKFAGTANIANLSIEDTLTLLATLSTGGLANRAGRLLRTTLLKALQDIDKVSKALDLDFDPNTGSSIEFILEMVNALKEIKTVENVPVELAETLGELFSVRGTEVLASLVSLEKTLKENIALRPDVDKFNKTFEDQLKNINRLVERHKNLNKEMGKAFVTGITGAEGYEKALLKIINTQTNLIVEMEKLGYATRNAFITLGVGGIIAFLAKYKVLLAFLTKFPIATPLTAGLGAGFLALNLKSEFDRLKAEEDKAIKNIEQFTIDLGKQMEEGLEGNLSLDALEVLIAKMQTFGAENLGFDEVNFNKILKQLIELRDVEREITKEKEKQSSQTEKQVIAENRRKEIAELVLQNELDILKLRGASESQVLKAEQLARKVLKIDKDDKDQIKDKLELQKALIKEKQLETTLSSRTLKLAEIAKTEGVDSARKIGEVLRGETDFDLFERIGGKNLDIFKREFADIFEEQKVIEFLENRGFSIPIDIADEEKVRGTLSGIGATVSIEQAKAESYISSLSTNTKSISEQMQELQKNTSALLSLEQQFRNFEMGGIARGTDIVQARQNQQIPGNQKITVDFNLNGRELNLSGTPEQIEEIIRQSEPRLFELFKEQVRNVIHNASQNRNDPTRQDINNIVEDF